MTDRTFRIERAELLRVFSPRAARAFEEMQEAVGEQGDAQTANLAATTALRDATFITLSANAELPNERVLAVAGALALSLSGDQVVLTNTGPSISGGHAVSFVVGGPCNVVLPLVGTLATLAGTETLSNKTLSAPLLSDLENAVDDAAAATAGVPVGGVYRNGSALAVRVT